MLQLQELIVSQMAFLLVFKCLENQIIIIIMWYSSISGAKALFSPYIG